MTQVLTAPPSPVPVRTMEQTVFDAAYAAFIAWQALSITEQNTLAAELNALSASMVAAAGANAIAITYNFNTATGDTDPGPGELRLDNATQNISTVMRMDLLDIGATDWTSVLDTLDDSTNPVKGQARLSKVGDGTKWIVFNVTSMASPSGYRNLSVTVVGASSASPFANGDDVTFAFTRAGDKGDQGDQGDQGDPGLESIPKPTAMGGTVDAITATYSPALTLTDMQFAFIRATGPNVSPTPTFAPDGLTAHIMTARGGVAVLPDDISGDHILQYHTSGTRWEVLNPAASTTSVSLIAFDDRDDLRALVGTAGALRQVESLGFFTWAAASLEADDDETCFASTGGNWELVAVDPELANAWALDAVDSIEGRFADRFITGTFSMTLTSLAANTSSAFTCSVPGAAQDDHVIVTPGDTFGTSTADKANLHFVSYLDSPGSATISIRNSSASSASMTASTWTVMVIKNII